VSSLIELLTDHPPRKYGDSVPPASPAWEAREALVKIGKPAVAELWEAAKSGELWIRIRAIDCLGLIGDPVCKDWLREAMKDDSPEIRAHASLALGRTGGRDTLEPLLAAARDGHPLVERYAVDGLWVSPTIADDPRAVGALLKLFNDPGGPTKHGIARVLGKLKDRRAVEPLIASLSGSMARMPWPIAAALSEIGDGRAVEPLIDLLEHPHSHARSSAVRALVKMEAGHDAYVAIAKLFAYDGAEVHTREVAVSELAKVGKAAVPALTDALTDKNPDVRDAAVATLRKIYGATFDDGGGEWLLWKRELLKERSKAAVGVMKTPSVHESVRRPLSEVAEFAIPGQSQVLKFLLVDGWVIASVRYGESAPQRPKSHGGRGDIANGSRTALVAWDPGGELLWKSDLPGAYHLIPAGNQIVLAYDAGGVDSPRGLIWIDPADGRKVRHVELPGRPATVAFNRHSESVVMVLYPDRRLRVIDDKTRMEVRSYRSDGTLGWAHEEPVSELQAVRLDGPAVVVSSYSSVQPFVTGLDPITGKPLWRRAWGRFPAVPEYGTRRPQKLDGLAILAKQEGIEFVDAATGATVHALPRPDVRQMTLRLSAHVDRIFYTSTELEGVTLAAQAFPGGDLLWSDETGTVSYRNPVAWDKNTVFLCRRLSQGLTGRVVVSELRIYGAGGELLAKLVKRRLDEHCGETAEGYFDDTVAAQAVDNRLYVVVDGRLIAMQWQ